MIAITIDCGAEAVGGQNDNFVNSVVDYLNANELSLSHILVTHYHYDHLGAVPALLKALKAEKVEGCIIAKKLYDHPWEKEVFDQIKGFTIKDLSDGDIIESDGIKISSVFTPGHCPDHMCYLLQPQGAESHVLFSGD